MSVIVQILPYYFRIVHISNLSNLTYLTIDLKRCAYTEMRSLLKVSSEEQVTLPEVDERTRRQKFIDAVKPFDTEDWRDLKWYGRIYIVVRVSLRMGWRKPPVLQLFQEKNV